MFVNPLPPDLQQILSNHYVLEEIERKRLKMEETKVKVLRAVGSWLLEGLGMYAMFAAAALVILGPRLLSVVLGLAAVFMVAYWVRRAGVALR